VSFSTILVANRGEIACRVMRTARTLGYRTVAVFSDADEHAPHVALADKAVRIGASPAPQSYLSIDALLAAARRTGADAVHPGYGFLSERADFARACAAAGLVFIGPPASAIEAMGDKARAKQRMVAAGVPCIAGYLGDAQDDDRLRSEALALGLPLLVKAVAGGGGRGMRLVRSADEIAGAITAARREAESAFGDGRLMLEHLVEQGRHVEVQVFADTLGHAVHLGERDCTAQRRRQKVIEEAPSPIVDAALRERLGHDAVAAAVAVGYVGAGTVEFIVDAQGRHFFLEMNTRLQVEHPVTECITGLDLVEWQLRVAAGEPLPLRQQEIAFNGHAIEARLYAEDPYDGFAPQTGRIVHWQPLRALRPGVRIDDGIVEGGEVSPYYDPMLAKLIVHGRDRPDAIRRLCAVLEDAALVGLKHNGRFLRDLLVHPDFAAARMHTTLIDDWAQRGEPILERPRAADGDWLIAAALRALRAGSGARPPGLAGWGLRLAHQGHQRALRVQTDGDLATVTMDGAEHRVRLLERDGHRSRVEFDGVRRWQVAVDDGDRLHLVRDAMTLTFTEPSPIPQAAGVDDPRQARAPVAGLVAQLLVGPGDRVDEGQPLASVEAMKMEMWLRAGAAGSVRAVHVAPREAVLAGALMIELTTEDDPP